MPTTTETPAGQAVQTFIAKVESGDLDGAIETFAEDARYHVPGQIGISGTYRGRQELKDFFVTLWTMTGGTVKLTVDDVLANEEHAVLYWKMTASRPDGRQLDAQGAMAFKFDAEGKVTESWFLYRDQAAYNAFWV